MSVNRPWTDEERETVRTMYVSAATASEIAAVLGRTRNMVIGWINREYDRNLKFLLEAKPSFRRAHKKKIAPPAIIPALTTQTEDLSAVRRRAGIHANVAARMNSRALATSNPNTRAGIAMIEAMFAGAPPDVALASFWGLESRSCRWCYGDPKDLDSPIYCGAMTDAGIALVPLVLRRSERPRFADLLRRND